MKVHLIAIGGNVMHNLAITLKEQGFTVSGSDDEIFNPAKSRLSAHGLLPKSLGWNADNISSDLDAIILGMHALSDNPELIAAKELNLKIYSFPEYVYEHTKDKMKVVIAGSHGKTSITSMVMHVLNESGASFDYLVGAQLSGFKTMVKLSKESKVAIIEGDEYPSSPIDPRPKFLLYHPQVALISGIAWDHVNVFPTFENYLDQFKLFIKQLKDGATLIYNEKDEHILNLLNDVPEGIEKIPYQPLESVLDDHSTFLLHRGEKVPILLFGKHNMENLGGALAICRSLGINEDTFFDSITSFKGAKMRLEMIGKNNNTALFRDFAHAPSKLKATVNAVKQQFPDRKLIACMELHTFSSLNIEYLQQYAGTMKESDMPVIYVDAHSFESKGLQPFTEQDISDAFKDDRLNIFMNIEKLKSFLFEQNWTSSNLLMMSSGNFSNLDFNELTTFVLK